MFDKRSSLILTEVHGLIYSLFGFLKSAGGVSRLKSGYLVNNNKAASVLMNWHTQTKP